MTPAQRAGAIPAVPPFHDEWSDANSPLEHSSQAEAGVHWTSAGRRVELTGSAVGGLETAICGPLRLESGPLLISAGIPLQPAGLHATPSEVRRAFRGAEHRSVERWFAALNDGVAFRQLDLPGTVAFEQTWTARAAGRTFVTAIDPNGQVALITSDESGARMLLALDAGRLESAVTEPGAAALRVSARGSLRLMVVTGADADDLDRSLQVVARRGFTGLRSQRVQHERLLREYGSGLSTPFDRLDTAFEWAKVRADETVRATGSVAAAEALLTVGLRDGARELVKGGCRAVQAAWSHWTGEQMIAPEAPPPLPSAASPARESPDRAADLAPDRLLRWVTGSLWGLVADAPRGAVALAPRLPEGWTHMALSRIRVGRSAIDCVARARGDGLTVRVRRASGPPLTLTVAAPGVPSERITVDGIELGGGRARFEAVGEHEVGFGSAA